MGRSRFELRLELAVLRADGLQDPLSAGRPNFTLGYRRGRRCQDSRRALQHLSVLAVDVGADHAGLVHCGKAILHDSAA